MEAYRWTAGVGAGGRALVLRAFCLHCERAVSIDGEPETHAGHPIARICWSCPYDDCVRPNLMGGVREINAVWVGHGAQPSVRRSAASRRTGARRAG
jgi:hypothetical protein